MERILSKRFFADAEDIHRRYTPATPSTLQTIPVSASCFVVLSAPVVFHRVDRLLRWAPCILVQPLDVVEKRLSLLREVLGLTPSPELEKVNERSQLRLFGFVFFFLWGGRGGGLVFERACIRSLAAPCVVFFVYRLRM